MVFKEQDFLLTNSWYPGPEFIEKYGIEVDKQFDCSLQLITKGTCTPVIFEFRQIDAADYFETATPSSPPSPL